MNFAKWIAVWGFILTGCGPLYPLTVTTSQDITARESQCDFQVLAIPPAGNWDEVGILSTQRETDDPAKFKTTVQSDVCKIGGEAVVTQVSADGTYVRGVVLRKARMVGANAASLSERGQ